MDKSEMEILLSRRSLAVVAGMTTNKWTCSTDKVAR